MSVTTHDAPLGETVAGLRRGDLDPGEYVDTLCDRIDAVDDELRAMLPECDRRARLHDAVDALLERHPDPADRPPLFGVPVGVKDIMHVDGFETRAGTAVPPELFQGPEATCVTRLRDAGAVVFGKTVTTEFAGGGPGLTRNPHDLDHTPGGSSSGSAAAVAAGLCPLATGTQTGGSVVRPATFCGVVGYKPSFGRVPRDGVIERSATVDHVGTFTQDVAGVSLAAAALCDEWGSVPDPDGLPALGVPEGTYLDAAEPEGREAFEAHVSRLEGAGCRIERVSVPAFADYAALDRRHRRLTAAELALVHEPWFDDYEAFYRTPMAEQIRTGREVSTGELARGREVQAELRDEFDGLLDDHDLDAWVAPGAPGPAPATLRGTGDPTMNRPWTYAGVPVLALPAGTAENGLPVGVQVAGRFGGDETLLGWGSALAEALSLSA
jgi:Asp-tRNA(Asn)/Glu-tRNA(Gln) amidotransferase A subunit family amidase